MKTFKKEILRVGEWKHKAAPGGVLKVTQEYLKQLADNFLKTPFVPVLRGHVSNEEAEKNPGLILNKNIKGLSIEGNSLFAEMDLDEKELEKYNDVSVGIDPDYEDHATGSKIGAVLKHVAAVMNPYIKGMGAFQELSDVNTLLINLSEITEMAKEKDQKLSEVELEEVVEETTESEEAKDTEVESTVTEENVETEAEEVVETTTEEEATESDEKEQEGVEASDVQAELVTLTKKLEEANIKLAEREAEDSYSVLLHDGRVFPAQREIYLSLHKKLGGQLIELSEGEEKSATMLLTELFEKAPKMINLDDEDIEEVDSNEELDDESVIKAELKKLPVHAQQSDDEYEEWFAENKEVAITSYKKLL